MEYRYQAQVQTSAAIIQAERKPLDSIRLSQWLNVQLLEAVTGDNIVIRPIAIARTFANDTERTTAANYNSLPVGSISYQTDSGVYYQTVGAVGAVPTVYNVPPLTYYAPANPGGGGGGTPVYKRFYYSQTAGTTQFENNTYTAITAAPANTNGPINIGGSGILAFGVYPTVNGAAMLISQTGFTANAAVTVRLLTYIASGSLRQTMVSINGGASTAWDFGTSVGAYEKTFNGIADSTGKVTISITQTNANNDFIAAYEIVGT